MLPPPKSVKVPSPDGLRPPPLAGPSHQPRPTSALYTSLHAGGGGAPTIFRIISGTLCAPFLSALPPPPPAQSQFPHFPAESRIFSPYSKNAANPQLGVNKQKHNTDTRGFQIRFTNTPFHSFFGDRNQNRYHCLSLFNCAFPRASGTIIFLTIFQLLNLSLLFVQMGCSGV